ncbi:J domain-containing protein [Halorubrum lacusprofundi]|uniref:Heat shock protein DnaJ domain protein n=1 Tax=Halorubrum lacusprofundi (strain ATCC 49239 / DSM 5036 / JCM 8891 / ACAM 34) TaxID=416348 RepID=B9LUH1_HALLT|nr:J domain-containing protein [Halorubrum lacusprofundi]ACM56328.1 heat shock protein DnaJ domain protein [Halorubrum lacusprofundi ATCC 49239]MCG1005364.1 DnaJ domain-containing protein [Halorubrum lacusprofundi]
MVVELIRLLPPWVVLGLALGIVASGLVALAFYLGNRYVGPVPNDGAGSAGPAGTASGAGSGAAGDERRRREIREYLRAIGEQFSEDHALDGVTVPFYLSERGVAITFDAHDYFRLEGEGIYTVLCEHEMPGRGLGRRLPFDVIEPEWATGGRAGRTRRTHRRVGGAGRTADRIGRAAGVGGRDPVAAAFAELDVATDADATEVKRAYRDRVKETHPDQGGDEAAFRRVREAYATARNHVGEGDGDVPRDDGGARTRGAN